MTLWIMGHSVTRYCLDFLPAVSLKGIIKCTPSCKHCIILDWGIHKSFVIWISRPILKVNKKKKYWSFEFLTCETGLLINVHFCYLTVIQIQICLWIPLGQPIEKATFSCVDSPHKMCSKSAPKSSHGEEISFIKKSFLQ